MVTLPEGAALKQAREPERAADAMHQMSSTGRQALDDVRRLLGVLRTEPAPQTRQPQPGIDRLDGLLDQVRATGLVTDATVTGTPDAVPPGAELAVYRIVQEALTNILRHAVRPTRVSVAVAVDCRRVARPRASAAAAADSNTRSSRAGTAADERGATR